MYTSHQETTVFNTLQMAENWPDSSIYTSGWYLSDAEKTAQRAKQFYILVYTFPCKISEFSDSRPDSHCNDLKSHLMLP